MKFIYIFFLIILSILIFRINVLYAINSVYSTEYVSNILSKNRIKTKNKIKTIYVLKNLNELDYSLKEFLKTGKPFVIRNPCGIHKILRKYKIKNQEIGKKSYMLTKEELNMLYSCDIMKIINKHINIITGVHLYGNYKTIGLHCDTSYPVASNIYIMIQGKKKVRLIHPKYSEYITKTKHELLEFRSIESSNKLKKYIPVIYEFKLEPGDILINDGTYWHEFTNLTKNTSVFSLRGLKGYSKNKYSFFFSLSRFPSLLKNYYNIIMNKRTEFKTLPKLRKSNI